MGHSIFKSRGFLRPSQLAAQKRRVKRAKFFGIVLLVLLSMTLLVLLMRMNFLAIHEVTISGNIAVKTDDLKSTVSDIISGNYLYFFPKNNILIYPKNKIEKLLPEKFPRIEYLKVGVSKNALQISLSERKPHSLWCGKSFSEPIDPCFFVDSDAFVFAAAPQFDGSSYVKFYSTSPAKFEPASSTEDILPDGNNPEAGWRFVSSEEYSNLQAFIGSVKELGIELTAVEISDAYNYKFQIKNNGILYISRDKNLDDSLLNLKVGVANDIFWTVPNKKSNVKKFKQVEYIDLRYGNKIFYKLK